MPTPQTQACLLCHAPSSWLHREDERDLLRCQECGLVFAWPPGDQAQEEQDGLWQEKYSTLTEGTEDLDTHPHRERIFRYFFAHLPAGIQKGRVLDIGCADGHFLTVARDHGWDVAGVEPSPPAARFAREHHQLDVRPSLEEHRQDAGRGFHLITLWDVLEHIQEPLPVLQQAVELLAPNGALFVRVPNLPYLMVKFRIWTQLLGHSKCFIPRVHCFNFASRHLRQLFQEAGLGPLQTRVGPPEVYGSRLRQLVQHAFFALGRGLGPESGACFALEAWAHRLT